MKSLSKYLTKKYIYVTKNLFHKYEIIMSNKYFISIITIISSNIEKSHAIHHIYKNQLN